MSELDAVKVGDKVIVCSAGFGRNLHVQVVEHATKTQIRVQRGLFRRKNGRLVGARLWDLVCIELPTPDLLARAEDEAANNRLDAVRWQDVPIEAKRTIWGIVKAALAPRGGV